MQGLQETIAHADALDRSGCVILESLLRDKRRKSATLEHIGFQEIILAGAWYIWWQRRESVKGEVVVSPPKSVLAIHAITTNYVGASSAGQITEGKWSKPCHNMYKMNVDACFMEDGCGATAAVLRNHHGQALAGSSSLVSHVLDAHSAEAMALKNGMMLADQLGCSNITFESDCLEIILACKGEVDILSPYSAILSDCFILAQRIGSVSYAHCPRGANQVAHKLARCCYDSNSVISWDNDPPQFILAELVSDVSLI
jgi:ribonuclease HI